MIFGIKTLKERKVDRQKESLRMKLQQMIWDLDWVNNDPSLDKIVDFFNYTEEALKGITKEECGVAPKALSNFTGNVARDQYGWFRAEDGAPATTDNTYIQPLYPMDEFFRTHSVGQLVRMTDEPCSQGDFLKNGATMTNIQYYNHKFVKPFMKSNLKTLIQIVDKELI
jgi:hypothetical protein